VAGGRTEEEELQEMVPSFYDGSVTVASGEAPALEEITDELTLAWRGRETDEAEGGAASAGEELGPEVDRGELDSQQRLT
jgi:hypothetical protein